MNAKPVVARSVAILGGAYNPPTIAYDKIVRAILQKDIVQEVWLMPYKERAFGKFMAADAQQRLRMAEILAGQIGEHVHASDIEISREGKSYTIDTVRELKRQYPDHTFSWIIGTDLLYELSDWKDIDQLASEVSFLGVLRPGYPVDAALIDRYHVQLLLGPRQMPDVSASLVRQRLASGKSMHGLVPEPIEHYIETEGLYRPETDPTLVQKED